MNWIETHKLKDGKEYYLKLFRRKKIEKSNETFSLFWLFLFDFFELK